MRTRLAILIMALAGLITGCHNPNSDAEVSLDSDIVVSVVSCELTTTTTTSCTSMAVTDAVTTHFSRITTPTTQTTAATVTTEGRTFKTKPPAEEPTGSRTSYTETSLIAETSAVGSVTTEEKVCPVTGITLRYTGAYHIYERPLNAKAGVVWYGGHKETYYSERILPGPGLAIPGRHHGEDGTIRDADGYICVAANYKFLPHGSIVVTSLGPGKVYDTGCAWGTIDIYTCW